MENIRKVFSLACMTAVILGTLFFAFGTLFTETIIKLFNKDGDVLLTQIASKGIKIYFIAFFVMGINIVTTTFFASISKSRYSLMISSVRGFLLIIPIILILPRILGLTGVWLTIPLTEFITLIVSAVYLMENLKKRV